MFTITNQVIDVEQQSLFLTDPHCGGLTFFEGRVRNHNQGHMVKSLEYQCYKEMALHEGKKIIDEALTQFSIKKARCLHREGSLKIGEIAVWVGVGSAHRDDAFHACRYIIDQVKARLPIWKKEYYQNRPAQWIACHNCAQHEESLL